jgi:hypothetical protein
MSAPELFMVLVTPGIFLVAGAIVYFIATRLPPRPHPGE